jgi:hypothetical protein
MFRQRKQRKQTKSSSFRHRIAMVDDDHNEEEREEEVEEVERLDRPYVKRRRRGHIEHEAAQIEAHHFVQQLIETKEKEKKKEKEREKEKEEERERFASSGLEQRFDSTANREILDNGELEFIAIKKPDDFGRVDSRRVMLGDPGRVDRNREFLQFQRECQEELDDDDDDDALIDGVGDSELVDDDWTMSQIEAGAVNESSESNRRAAEALRRERNAHYVAERFGGDNDDDDDDEHAEAIDLARRRLALAAERLDERAREQRDRASTMCADALIDCERDVDEHTRALDDAIERRQFFERLRQFIGDAVRCSRAHLNQAADESALADIVATLHSRDHVKQRIGECIERYPHEAVQLNLVAIAHSHIYPLFDRH